MVCLFYLFFVNFKYWEGDAVRSVVTSFEVISERKTRYNTTKFHKKQLKKTNKNNKFIATRNYNIIVTTLKIRNFLESPKKIFITTTNKKPCLLIPYMYNCIV